MQLPYHRTLPTEDPDALAELEAAVLATLHHHGLQGTTRTAFTATLDADNKVYGARLHADYSTGTMEVRVYAYGGVQSQHEFAQNVAREVDHALEQAT